MLLIPREVSAKRKLAGWFFMRMWVLLELGSLALAMPGMPGGTLQAQQDASNHWATQALQNQPPPDVGDTSWIRNGIDAFILQKLEEKGIEPSARAHPRILMRRLSFDLLGLPPSAEEVSDFEKDASPLAWEAQVDRSLNDPSYGKRWGRHWLDVARYADAKGYVDAGEPTFPFAYTYRDYVVDAFNSDKPYPRFILEQLAADRLEGVSASSDALAALGFLTVGSRFNFFPHDVIDDRIDVVTRGFMGLTVSCARCHDHKFDPVSAADYYALYGMFRNSFEPTPDQVPVLTDSGRETAWASEIREAGEAYRTLRRQQHRQVMHEMRAWSGDYLRYVIQTTPRHRTQDQPDLITERGMIREVSAYAGGAVKHWRGFLNRQPPDHPIFGLWARLFALENAASVGSRFQEMFLAFRSMSEVNQRVVAAFTNRPIAHMADVADVYGELLETVDAQWRQRLEEDPGCAGMPTAEDEALRQVLYGADAPSTLRVEEAIDYLTLDESVAIRKARAEVERVFLKHWSEASPRPMMLKDRDEAFVTHVFKRGDPDLPGLPVRPHVPASLTLGDAVSIDQGSGRLELAQALADPSHPLVSRVIVNRIWDWHFGAPLVATRSDFGWRSDRPEHGALLDWLAQQWVRSGGSFKAMHRLILTSSTWQQSSQANEAGMREDPINQWFGRMPRRRLDFESTRDAVLHLAGVLQDPGGGVPVRQSPQDPDNTVRTLYTYVDRENLDDAFRVFDFPSPDISAPHRVQTTVPQQALFLLNSPFILKQARALAEGFLRGRPANEETFSSDRISALFVHCLQRLPEAEERAAMQAYLQDRANELESDAISPWAELIQTLFLSNEFQFID